MTEDQAKENYAIERVMQAAYMQAIAIDPIDTQEETLYLLEQAFNRQMEALNER